MTDWVDLRNVQVVAASADLVVDAVRVSVTECTDEIVGKTVSRREINALEIAPTFEEIRIQEVRIERVLLDVLPISAEFPGMLFGRRAGNQAERIAAADRKPNLIRFAFV